MFNNTDKERSDLARRAPHRTVYGYGRKIYGVYGDIVAVTVTVNIFAAALTVRYGGFTMITVDLRP